MQVQHYQLKLPKKNREAKLKGSFNDLGAIIEDFILQACGRPEAYINTSVANINQFTAEKMLQLAGCLRVKSDRIIGPTPADVSRAQVVCVFNTNFCILEKFDIYEVCGQQSTNV